MEEQLIEKVKTFLSKANKNTYANKNAVRVKSLRPNSEDYHFEEEDLAFHDTYFGGRDFIGGEIIYKDNIPIWGANYFGFILEEGIESKELSNFLRDALMQEYESDIPVRGPAEFISGKWGYKFVTNGSLSNFSGEEIILLNGKIVYRLLIHGGLIR